LTQAALYSHCLDLRRDGGKIVTMAWEGDHHDVPHRGMITACAIGATVLQLLDQTIANVALPYMQGSFSASFDEITWVLTSYITASAIITAPVGWLAARYGRKPLYFSCILGFTFASMLCGAAQSLGQIVVFRVLQGIFGAALVSLSQATLLDIYPVERRGFAMAIWGVGVMLGPIMGPTVGGWLKPTAGVGCSTSTCRSACLPRRA
jgi:MFS transporter, DHA2 family, multidrug resistance protein